MTVPARPALCYSCQRMRGFDATHPKAFCAAFPAGIPDAIIVGGFDHRQPFSGDKGVRYLLEPDDAGLLALYEGRAVATP